MGYQSSKSAQNASLSRDVAAIFLRVAKQFTNIDLARFFLFFKKFWFIWLRYFSFCITYKWRDLVKILMTKLWHASSFLLERTDFENVIFEKIPWPLLRTPGSKRSNNLETQNNKNSRRKIIKIRWNNTGFYLWFTFMKCLKYWHT